MLQRGHSPLLALVSVVILGSLMAPTSVHAACVPASLSTVALGQSGFAVKVLQECLIQKGYAIPAGVTGYYGSQTKLAVQAFYKEKLGLPDWNGLSVGPKGRAALASGMNGTPSLFTASNKTSYKRATSIEELKKYVTSSPNVPFDVPTVAGLDGARSESAVSAPATPARTLQDRVSETNVQVRGIDEPDIVKTDGTSIYFSRAGYWYGGPMVRAMDVAESSMPVRCEPNSKERCVMPEQRGVTAITAFPLEKLGVASEHIKERGEMLFVKDTSTLIILSYPSIVAYNVKNPSKPTKMWELGLEQNTSVQTARLKDNTVYLVTQTYLDQSAPCPVVPLMRGSQKVSIACGDIWIPERVVPVDTAYSVLTVDPASGTVKEKIALTLPSGEATVAMFENNLYLTAHSYYTRMDTQAALVIEAAKPYLTASTYEKARKILGYDISSSGKYSEIEQLVQNDFARYEADERLRVQNEIQQTLSSLVRARARDLDRSSIVRIALSPLSLTATGEIPGKPLNQFALDEHNGNVRVAVTVQPDWNTANSVNDVYVLGMDLKERGSIRNLGLGERIYSARFMGDTGYLVTFRQIDPFYVLDLSMPTAPKMVGELKIPGYSSYLEPLGGDLVLGVGREGNDVKLSVFDVSNLAKPTEKAKYILKESWTEVDGNHHAFLRDAKHSVFFLPGGDGGYLFSYANGTLSLKRAVAGYDVKRALYINDYLYVLGENKLTVIDEATWKDVKSLAL